MEGLLFALLLLLRVFLSVPTSAEGELCRAWHDGVDPLLGAFQCPESLDGVGTDAQFCCGTCSAPYCCSSGEARLDQARCSLLAPQKAEAGPTLRIPAPTSAVGEIDPNSGAWMAAGMWVTAVILCILISCCLCCHSRIRTWLNSKVWWRIRSEEAEPAELHNLHCRPWTGVQAMSSYLPPLPPYGLCAGSDPIPTDPPPSYSSLDLTGSGAAPLHRSREEAPQEEVALVPSGTASSLEPVGKKETTV